MIVIREREGEEVRTRLLTRLHITNLVVNSQIPSEIALQEGLNGLEPFMVDG